MTDTDLLTAEIERQISIELFQIWQEAKSDCPDNWDDIQFNDLPGKHKDEYFKTAKRIRVLSESLMAQRIAEAREKWVKDLQTYLSVQRIKDDECFTDGDYVIMPLEQWIERFEEGG